MGSPSKCPSSPSITPSHGCRGTLRHRAEGAAHSCTGCVPAPGREEQLAGPGGTSVPCLSEGGGIFRAVLSRCWTRGPASTGGREIPVPPALRGQSSEGGPESLVSSPGAGTADPGGKAPALISASTSCAFKFDSQAAALFVFFLSLCGSGGREGYRQ